MLVIPYDGDRYGAVLVALAISYNGYRYSTTVRWRSIQYYRTVKIEITAILYYRTTEIDTILYLQSLKYRRMEIAFAAEIEYRIVVVVADEQ